MRLFWGMMTLGIGFWLVYQLLWTYFELVLRKDVPDPFGGDIILFLHIVPLIAAIAMRPHVPRDEYAARVGRLDFLLLIVWWVYLYVLMVMPWQYAFTDALAYSHNLNAVYLVEKLVFLLALAACWIGSKGEWKTFYANFFGASLMYSASSYLANWAIARNVYYSGSLYDIPLAASMAWVTIIGLSTRAHKPQWEAESSSTVYGVWIARGSMIAAFSLPLFAVWALSDTAVPARIRSVRLLVTLGAALVLGGMVFLRQRLLDAELVRLLKHSRESVENLKVLQAQIIHSEKLASIGQLVGGAAHELNNPITAMLGYSDLLVEHAVDARAECAGHPDRAACSAYEISGGQPVELRQAGASLKNAGRFEHPGAHRGEAHATPVRDHEDRGSLRTRQPASQSIRRLQPVAAGVLAGPGQCLASAERARRTHSDYHYGARSPASSDCGSRKILQRRMADQRL